MIICSLIIAFVVSTDIYHNRCVLDLADDFVLFQTRRLSLSCITKIFVRYHAQFIAKRSDEVTPIYGDIFDSFVTQGLSPILANLLSLSMFSLSPLHQ